MNAVVASYAASFSRSHTLKATIAKFADDLPYLREPYSSRSWGHPLHSLCCYQGKLKPAVAYSLVNLFTDVGMTVLDPLGGVGTVGLEACIQGRQGITNDLSPLAYAVATPRSGFRSCLRRWKPCKDFSPASVVFQYTRAILRRRVSG